MDTVVPFWMAFLGGDLEPLDVILKKSSNIELFPDMEKVNGFDYYVIEAVTPHGKYKLWIDPEHGYNVAKAETHKANNEEFTFNSARGLVLWTEPFQCLFG